MARNPSSYAGVAAAAVFLTGLFIVGNTSVRIAVSSLVVFLVALALAPTGSARALIGAIVAAICSGLVAYHALSCEKTGHATLHHWGSRGAGWNEPVTREGAPAKFREATNNTWALSLLLLMASGGLFVFHRKLESSDEFP